MPKRSYYFIIPGDENDTKSDSLNNSMKITVNWVRINKVLTGKSMKNDWLAFHRRRNFMASDNEAETKYLLWFSK